MKQRPVVLMILDGYGISDKTQGNAIAMANTPVMDRLMKESPFVRGYASGEKVGLPDGQMGNSEVGHMNIGSGRIIYQDLTLITKYIKDGVFFENEELLLAVNNCKEKGSDLHIWGLLSDGGVHSHNTHLYAVLELAKKEGLENVYVHPFFDGRDTPPASGKDYLQELVDKMDEIGVGKVASLSGRYYAMDRDNNWDRIQKAYDSLVTGEGVQATDPIQAMQDSYDNGVTDEFVVPTVITDENGAPLSLVKPDDSVIFFNFRPDRAREITRAFCCNEEDFAVAEGQEVTTKDMAYLKRANGYMPLTFVCFKDYDESIPNKHVAFKKVEIENTFGEYLAANGLKQLRTAETEKYAHVTFFFNGGKEEPNKDEDRLLINSPAVATYDMQPEMSAPEVSEKLNAAIRSGEYDVIVVNFANPDMVGHTGVIDAAVKAVEEVDACVGSACEAVKEADGVLFICADHGNAEQMINYETGGPFTAHTTNQVPFILYNYDSEYTLREGGALCDIVPTLLEVMDMPQPEEMTGKSLLVKKNNDSDAKIKEEVQHVIGGVKMSSAVKKIGILTSGGDAPGMNAAIRAAARTAWMNGVEVAGIYRGYAGLLDEEIFDMPYDFTHDIVQRGGTVLYTARCLEFKELSYQKKAADILKDHGIDGLIVIGGDGSFRGAQALARQGVNVVAVPGTIDLDISCTEYTIGFDTAVNTAMANIDKIKETSTSHDRCSIIEVMGRNAGYIALWCGIASGAEEVLIPEKFTGNMPRLEAMLIDHIMIRKGKGRRHHMIINAEGIGKSFGMARDIEQATGVETRATILGYVQRGGTPTATDRVHASYMGSLATDLLCAGATNRVVGYANGQYVDFDIEEALGMRKDVDEYEYRMATILGRKFKK